MDLVLRDLNIKVSKMHCTGYSQENPNYCMDHVSCDVFYAYFE